MRLLVLSLLRLLLLGLLMNLLRVLLGLLLLTCRRHVVRVCLCLGLTGARAVMLMLTDFAVAVLAVSTLLFCYDIGMMCRSSRMRSVCVIPAQVEVLLSGSSVRSSRLLLLLLLLDLLLLSLGGFGLLGVLLGRLSRSNFFAVTLIGVRLRLSVRVCLSVRSVGMRLLGLLGFLLAQILGFFSPSHGLETTLSGRRKRWREVVMRGMAILLATRGRETELRARRWSRGRRVGHVAGRRVGRAARGTLDAAWTSRRVASSGLVRLGRRWLAQVMLLHDRVVAMHFGLCLNCSCLSERVCLDLTVAGYLILALPFLLHQRPIPPADRLVCPLVGARVRKSPAVRFVSSDLLGELRRDGLLDTLRGSHLSIRI